MMSSTALQPKPTEIMQNIVIAIDLLVFSDEDIETVGLVSQQWKVCEAAHWLPCVSP